MNNNLYVERFKALGEKYDFPVKAEGKRYVLTAKNTDNKDVNWISYNPNTDMLRYLGNTDNCNIWLCDTRKDFTPEKAIQFIKDLNEVFELEGSEKFLLRNLIDPEDWQEMANVHDAYEDMRYNCI